MFVVNTHAFATAALAGALFLRPVSMAPERAAYAPLAPDSFVRAVAARNPVLLDLSVTERLNVNTPDAEGRTPLLVATMQRDRDLVRRLLEVGANVALADWTGRTPLMVAAMHGDLDLLETFLARSSRPEVVDSEGQSAAHYALAARQMECFKLLLPHVPEKEVPTTDGRDLLALACDSGNREAIRLVLGRLPDGNEWTSRARSALTVALAANDSDLLRLLLSKYPAPTVEGGTVPLLAQAIVEDDAAAFRILLAAGADPNTTLPTPCEPEFLAQISSENLRGYVKADQKITVLMVAAGLGKLEYVRALLDAGADKNRQTTRYKMLALYFAARTKDPKCVQMLLGRGPTREELRVEISLATQRASLIKNGIAILHTPISTGRKGFDTPVGEYVITDKARTHRSTLYHAQMPFFMRLNCLDFGMHAGVVPNYPASHGCIRLPSDVAQKIFAEVPVGTMVTIN